MPTAVVSVQAMLKDLIKTDTELATLLSDARVYVGKVPVNKALPYVVLGQTTETPEGASYYRHPGHQGTEALHCWAKSKYTAQQIFARLSVLLDRQRPVVIGHTVMKGVLEYVTDSEGGDGKSWQVTARYRVKSLVAA